MSNHWTSPRPKCVHLNHVLLVLGRYPSPRSGALNKCIYARHSVV